MKKKIKELSTVDEWVSAFPVIVQLRKHLTKDSYISCLEKMYKEDYRLFALYCNEKIVAVAGAKISINLYYGRYVWLYDFVTDSHHRSKGFGEELIRYIEKWALKNECELVALSSGLQRKDAHRFYEHKGYKDVSKVFVKRF